MKTKHIGIALLLLVAVICLFSSALFAQLSSPISLGVHGGIVSTKLDTKIPNVSDLKDKSDNGMMLGAFARINIKKWYIQPELNQYKYMLEGLDRDWVYSGRQNTVTYAGLKSGRYIFRANGSNSDGIWNEELLSPFIFYPLPGSHGGHICVIFFFFQVLEWLSGATLSTGQKCIQP